MIRAKRDIFNSFILLAFCGLAYYGATQIPVRSFGKTSADFFPKIAIGVTAFLSICLLINSIYRMTKEKDAPVTVSLKEIFLENRKVILTFIMFAVYVILLEVIGYFVSSILFLVGLYYLLAAKKQKVWIILPGAIVLTFILYLIFEKALSVFLPAGLLF